VKLPAHPVRTGHARLYGKTTWRKKKGIAKIRLADGGIRLAELHWYEGHGKGRKETKIKKYLE
jgi:hypothetical protein